MRMLLSPCFVLVISCINHMSVTAQQNKIYWWLGLPSPFGGRNYNLEEIQRGEHISNSSRFSRVGGGQRSFRRFSKRQSEDEILQNEIDIDDIETECPRLSQCVPRFFCERFRGRTVFDQIPCLLTSGDFAGEFGICCQDEFPRKCPDVPQLPPPEQCQPRPLGQPEDDQCDSVGVRDVCPGNTLCCFNGCLNVCLRDPPYTVQKAYFFRQKAFIVNPDEVNEPINTEFNEGNNNPSSEFDNNEDDLTGVIDPRTKLDRLPRKLKSRSDKDASSQRISQLLRRLLDRLRDRIS